MTFPPSAEHHKPLRFIKDKVIKGYVHYDPLVPHSASITAYIDNMMELSSHVSSPIGNYTLYARQTVSDLSLIESKTTSLRG